MILAYVRAIILYLTLIGAVRLLGKRQIGQLEPSEFVVAMLLADLAAIPMQDASLPLLAGHTTTKGKDKRGIFKISIGTTAPYRK